MTTWDVVGSSGIARVNVVSQSGIFRIYSWSELDLDKGPRRSMATNDMGLIAGKSQSSCLDLYWISFGTYARLEVGDVVLNVTH